KGLGFGLYITGSAIDELGDQKGSKLRFGDVIGVGFGVGVASPFWLNIHIEAGGQVAYEFADWLDLGLKIYGEVNLDRLNFIGLVIKPNVRVGPVLLSWANAVKKAPPDVHYLKLEGRYILDRASPDGYFAGVDLVQTTGTNTPP